MHGAGRARLEGHGFPKEMIAVITLAHDLASIHHDLAHRLGLAASARPDVHPWIPHQGKLTQYLLAGPHLEEDE